MSHVNKRVPGHSSASGRAPRAHPQEEDMEVDQDAEEAEEDDPEGMEDEDDSPLSVHTGKSKNLTEIAEKIVFELKVNPDDPETREAAKLLIRKMYINNGGLPFNSKDPIPYDLENLSDKELGFVVENMLIHQARTQKSEVIAQAANTFSNVAYLMTGEEAIITQINSDNVLRQALLDTFLGSRISPLLTLIISASSHISNLIRSYVINGKRTVKPTTPAPNQSQEPASSSGYSAPASYDSGFRPPEQENNKRS